MSNGRPSIRIALAATALAAALVVPGAATAPAASGCKNLKAPKSLNKKLRKAHRKLTKTTSWSGPRKAWTYYGGCGSTRYALASFKDKTLGYQDQPEGFVKKRHKSWKDVGDTGGDGCGVAPHELERIWSLPC